MQHNPTFPRRDDQLSRSHRPARSRQLEGSVASVVAGAIAAPLLLVAAYHQAYVDPHGELKYTLFWLGILAFVVPAGVRLLGRHASRNERLVEVVGLGVLTYLPKVLRAPHLPAFYDEIAHWDQANRLVHSGVVFAPSDLVWPARHYPVLHLLLAGGNRLTGASIFDVGLVLAGLAHLATLAAVWMLARRASGDVRLAGAAALVYAASPGFAFVTDMVAYETFGLPLALFTVVAALAAADRHGRARLRFAGLAVVLATAAGTTHHLSAFMAAGLLALVAAARLAQAGRDRHRETAAALRGGWLLAGLAAYTLAFELTWIGLQSWHLLSYLTSSTDDALRFATGGGALRRRPFQGSVLPRYEQIAGILAPALALGLAGLGWLRRRAGLAADTALRTTSVVCTGLYAASLPFVLSAVAIGPAHRTWPFLWAGVAPLAAAGLLVVVDGGPHVVSGLRGRRIGDVVLPATAMACTVVLFVGFMAVDASEPMRFPVPSVLGADAGSTTPETLAAARWMQRNAGPCARVVSDKYVGANLVAYGDAWMVPSFPTWELTFGTGPVARATLARLAARHVGWLAVDTRMYRDEPVGGVFYSGTEPGAYEHHGPLPRAALTKLYRAPWAEVAYRNAQVTLFRIDVRGAHLSAAEIAAAAPTLPGALAAVDTGCHAAR